MYYYKTTLRLGGHTTNEVVKIVSAPEFLLIGFIHGQDALTKVKEVKTDKVDYAAEKDRLKQTYEVALRKNKQSVDSIFGALGNLPSRLPESYLEKYEINPEGLIDIDPEDLKKSASTKAKVDPRAIKSPKEIENEKRIINPEEVNVADLMG